MPANRKKRFYANRDPNKQEVGFIFAWRGSELWTLQIFKIKIKKSKTYSGWCPYKGLSIQWYHSQADPIWPDGTFNADPDPDPELDPTPTFIHNVKSQNNFTFIHSSVRLSVYKRPRCQNFRYFWQHTVPLKTYSLVNFWLKRVGNRIRIRIGRPWMWIRMRQNDADPNGSGSTTRAKWKWFSNLTPLNILQILRFLDCTLSGTVAICYWTRCGGNQHLIKRIPYNLADLQHFFAEPVLILPCISVKLWGE